MQQVNQLVSVLKARALAAIEPRVSSIPESRRQRVRARARQRCEYCGLPEGHSLHPFHVDHILSVKHGGTSKLDNLAWACFNCNVFKGSDIAGYDPDTGDLVPSGAKC